MSPYACPIPTTPRPPARPISPRDCRRTGSTAERRIPCPYKYPYGGEEHRYEPAIDDELPLNLEDAARMNPLSRPVASWSEDDLRRVMASPACWQPGHRGRARAHVMVREWFERAEGTSTARVDATGRPVGANAAAAAPAGGACEVPVRAHSGKGGDIEVDAHCRSRPAA